MMAGEGFLDVLMEQGAQLVEGLTLSVADRALAGKAHGGCDVALCLALHQQLTDAATVRVDLQQLRMQGGQQLLVLGDRLRVRAVIEQFVIQGLFIPVFVVLDIVHGVYVPGGAVLAEAAVPVADPSLALGTAALAVGLGTLAGGPDVTVVGAVHLFGDRDPLLRAAEVDFVLAVGILICIDCHKKSSVFGSPETEERQRQC